ncbi:gp58-like family protein [Lactobacillus delbrueckii]|uniref:gp58-like family protein n=1 Tax=Lactobacillus delbrueckii TaxID=1584 RepID=UPI003A8729A0
MLSQTDAVKQAWAATDRTLDIIVTVDGKDYQATEINSLSYDAGAFTGDTLGIGSTYENSVTIEFSSVVEAFKQGLTVLPKVGILVDGTFEYTNLGTFIISEVNRDRNNNLTTIKALDQMCKLEGQYKPTVSDTASPLDIIADIANQGGVAVNTGELQHLPALPNIKKIDGQTLRTAIGWVAQLYGGFAVFDRDGKLTIRTTATPDYTITPGEYQQGGLTKNEVAYKAGGIKATVNTKKTDDSGQEVDDTTTLQAGETTGSQIELTNDSMTSDLLTTVWTGIKDVTYYPYALNWFGNPNLEAGDWVTLTDTQGNQFNVPVNQYTMSFNGGLESTISATQSSSTAGGYAYTGSAGSIKNMIEALQVRHTASGSNVYPPSYQGQPQNPKKGDVWYKQNGNNIEVWIYQEDGDTLSWVRAPIDGEVKADLQALGTKTNDDLTRVKNELSSEAETQWQSMKAATSAVASDLSATKDSLAAVSNDLSATKTSLEDTRTSLSTTAAELRDKTGQLSGSLSTANSKIEYNSNAIAEVKHTAEEVSTTVSNLKSGDRNYARNTSNEWQTLTGFTGATTYTPTFLGTFVPYDLQVGDTVTIGYTIKNSGIQSGKFNIQAPGDSTGWNAGFIFGTQYDISKVCPDGATITLIQYYTLTADNLKNSSFYFNIRTDNFPAGTLSYKGLFVKKGNLATDWSPAPEDTDQAISQVSQTADAIRADLTNTKGDIASVKATASAISTDLTDAKGDIASVKATADSLTADMKDAKGNISSLQATASGLQSSVTDQSGKISQLQHDADGLNFTVANGSQNLILNSGNPSTLEHWSSNGDLRLQPHPFWKNSTENLFVLSNTSSTNKKTLSSDRFQIEPNQTYTLSYYAFNSWAIKDTDVWYLPRKTGSSNDYDTAIQLLNSVKYTGSYAQYMKLTFNSGDYNEGYIRFDNNASTAEGTSAELWLTDIQLEKGSIATAWHPSPGDIANLKITADGLKATVGDDNTGLVSYVKAIPGQISSAITASKQAKVITSAVDVHNMTTAGYYLLKGPLTNSPVDAWAFLRVITSDSGDRIYHKIWKDDSSTVYTEEWTGEWSGWATHINSDNLKSNVITAINQSTEGVSITGSKITLDGNVNVTPGFTLSADYIKAGTLSADRISGGTLDFSSNITVKGLTANSISSGSISGQNLNINLDNGTVEFTKGNLHSTDGGFNISIDTKSFYLDMGNGSKLWIDSNGFHLQESASQHLWMNKDGLHNFTDANGNGLWINDTELRILNSNNAGLVAKDGMLQFSANPIWNSSNVYSGTLDSQLYGTIGFSSNLLSSSLNGLFIKGREGIVIGTNSYGGGSLFGPDGYLDVGEAGSGINLPDSLNQVASIFTQSALTLLGGPTYRSGAFTTKAQISIGCDTYYTHSGAGMYSNSSNTRGNNILVRGANVTIQASDWVNIKSDNGNGRIALDAQYVHSYPTYNQTTSAGANVYVAPDGALIRSSSARKYKTDIQDANNAYGEKLIEFAPKKWIDKAEKKRYEEDPENNKKPGYYYGLIADDLDAAGLDMLVNYGAEGEVEGINYDRLAVALLPVIKSLKDQVASLKKQLKALTK